MDLGLEGRVALVAAASRGLGAAIARILAEEGCTVEICSRSLDRVQHTAEVISANTGRSVIGSEVDVTDGDAITAWVNEAAVRHGGLDIVIPNAGGPKHGSFQDTGPEDWDAGYELTLRSALSFASAAKPHLVHDSAMLYLTSSSRSVSPYPPSSCRTCSEPELRRWPRRWRLIGPKMVSGSTSSSPGVSQPRGSPNSMSTPRR